MAKKSLRSPKGGRHLAPFKRGLPYVGLKKPGRIMTSRPFSLAEVEEMIRNKIYVHPSIRFRGELSPDLIRKNQANRIRYLKSKKK